MATQYEVRKAKEEAARLAAEEMQKREVLGEAVKEAVYDHTAYDVFYDETTKKYIKVVIEYDRNLKVGRVREEKAIADSQPVALQKMGLVINRKIFRLPEQ